MALTLNVQTTFAHKGNEPGIALFTLTFGTAPTYATGGVTVDLTRIIPSGSRWTSFKQVVFVSSLGHTALYVPGTNATNGKIELFVGITEVANTTSLTGLVLTGHAFFGSGLNGIQTTGLAVG